MEYSETIIQKIVNSGKTKASVAAAIGCNKSLFSQWEKKPTSKITLDIVVKIARYLNVTVDNLLFDEMSLSESDKALLNVFHLLPDNEQQRFIGRCSEISDRLVESQNKRRKISMRKMDVAVIAAGAGVSFPFTEDDSFEKESFPIDEIPVGADCGIPIDGDSMEPEYPNGCIVWVNRNCEIRYGDEVIAIVDGCPLFKVYQEDGLHSYNSKYSVITTDHKIEIFGKVIGYYMNEEPQMLAARSYSLRNISKSTNNY